jgi:hypothetical protein
MKQANNGTIIIEEADSVTDNNLEEILITRYSTSSADNKKMVPDGHKGWDLAEFATFGATVAHRRNLFRDAALIRRVITVKGRRVRGDFSQVTTKSHASLFRQFRECLAWHPKLPEATNKWDVEPGIFDCYKPLVTLATFIDDTEFLNKLVEEMKVASDRLREEETYLEPQMLLRAIIGIVSKKVGDKITPDQVNIEINKISPALRIEFDVNCPVFKLGAGQRNRILREFGFNIKSSHSRNRLYLTIPQLIEVCEENGIQDECFAEWKAKLEMSDGGNQKESDTGSLDAWETED